MKTAALATPLRTRTIPQHPPLQRTNTQEPSLPIKLYNNQTASNIPQPLLESEIQPSPENSETVIKKLLLAGFDSLTRTLIRFIESFAIKPFFKNSEVARVAFRGVSELGRKYAESYVTLGGNKLSNEDKTTIWTRALENTIGSAIADPLNGYSSAFSRVGTGFANMTARLGTRIGLYGLNITNLDKVALKNSVGELAYRSLGRILAFQSKNPLIVLGRLFGEQFVINSCLQFKPVNHLFDTVKSYMNKDAALKQEQEAA